MTRRYRARYCAYSAFITVRRASATQPTLLILPDLTVPSALAPGRSQSSLLQRLGAGVGNKNDHTSMILIGNDPADVWTRTYGLSSPTVIIKVITDTASRK